MNLLFDLDGTLTDSRRGILACLRHALAALDHPCPADHELDRCLGPPLSESFGWLLATADEARIEIAIAKYRERYAAVGMFENEVYPGVRGMLAACRSAGARLFVATSKPVFYATQIVEHFGLAQHFEAIYGAEMSGERGDKTALIAHILERERLASSTTIMVGDRMHDMVGARANGVPPIGALWGYGSEAELELHGAAAVCERPGDVAAALPFVTHQSFNAAVASEPWRSDR
jgi:phosphoglycolate phosphatase